MNNKKFSILCKCNNDIDMLIEKSSIDFSFLFSAGWREGMKDYFYPAFLLIIGMEMIKWGTAATKLSVGEAIEKYPKKENEQ